MNYSNTLNGETTPPGIYQRCLWALAIFGIVLIFFFISWLSIQRVAILVAHRQTREAEQRILVAQRERDEARRQGAAVVKELREQLAKVDAERAAAEKDSKERVIYTTRASASPHSESAGPKIGVRQTLASEPNAQELKAFIQAHLSRMAGTVDVSDYADQVDFHDKPRAAIELIENERKQWAQKYPVRVIFADEIQPQFSAVRDATYPWVATAIFNWRFEFRTRTGAVIRGVARDIWKIAPTNSGLRIVAEHSADPTTGASKD
ncbi:MAG: hypothetical protein P4L99_17190 [Chthoniobacter sp.]|nr:hypothetical protein [Chthoniobacter sp.]